MACISKLANAITYNCDTGSTGFVSAMIINKADIEGFDISPSGYAVSRLSLAEGATPFKIDTVKRSLVMSSALKVNDGAPNAYTHSANIVYTGLSDSVYRDTMASLANGSFVIFARMFGNLSGNAYGLYYGLSVTGVDSSSHDNGGWTTITMATPENVIGEDMLTLVQEEYNRLYAAAV
mgnify:CR=1 FL=1|jgi:hypothetical protein